jgi:hypothetical protein
LDENAISGDVIIFNEDVISVMALVQVMKNFPVISTVYIDDVFLSADVTFSLDIMFLIMTSLLLILPIPNFQ